MRRATFFLWRRKYAGATVADVRHILGEAENAKLKRMYAELFQRTGIPYTCSRFFGTGDSLGTAAIDGTNRIDDLVDALLDLFKRVLIDLEANDDAQVINRQELTGTRLMASWLGLF